MTAANDLLAFLKGKAVEIDDLTAQEWADKLTEISKRPPDEQLSGLRYMVYQTFVREENAAKAKGERYKGRTDHENDTVVRHLSEWLAVPYERPRDPAREAAFEAAHADPFSQAKWFEDNDIMN